MCLNCLQTRGRVRRSDTVQQHFSYHLSSRPQLRDLNTCIPDCCPPLPSSCCGTSDRVPASYLHPRRDHGHLGAGRCDPRPSPWCTFPLSCTGRTADGLQGIAYELSAMPNRILGQLQAWLLPDGMTGASRSTSSRKARARRILDGGRECSDGWALTFSYS